MQDTWCCKTDTDEVCKVACDARCNAMLHCIACCSLLRHSGFGCSVFVSSVQKRLFVTVCLTLEICRTNPKAASLVSLVSTEDLFGQLGSGTQQWPGAGSVVAAIAAAAGRTGERGADAVAGPGTLLCMSA